MNELIIAEQLTILSRIILGIFIVSVILLMVFNALFLMLWLGMK